MGTQLSTQSAHYRRSRKYAFHTSGMSGGKKPSMSIGHARKRGRRATLQARRELDRQADCKREAVSMQHACHDNACFQASMWTGLSPVQPLVFLLRHLQEESPFVSKLRYPTVLCLAYLPTIRLFNSLQPACNQVKHAKIHASQSDCLPVVLSYSPSSSFPTAFQQLQVEREGKINRCSRKRHQERKNSIL